MPTDKDAAEKLSNSGSAQRRRSAIPLYVIGGVYVLWLLWLAYLAWINIQTGNQ